MGQKMDPHGLRVGIIKDWDSKWYANKKDFADNLVEDYKIREIVSKFEDKDLVSSIREEDNGINIYIGSENTLDDDVAIIKTKAHSDNIFNNTCDEMAKDIIDFWNNIKSELH